MKKRFLGSISLIALNAGGSALAADMPVKARPAPPPAVYSWTGCYGGGFVGYGWGNSQHRSLDPRQFPGFRRDRRVNSDPSRRHHAVL